MTDIEPKAAGRLAERVQFIASAMLIIFPVGWFLWFYPYDDLLDRSGTPLGADYTMFYVAGQIVADGATDQLYDQAEHQRRLHAQLPGLDEEFCLPFRYPPFVALLMVPLAQLPYALSYAVFLSASVSALFCALWLLRGELTILRGLERKTILIAVAGWPVVLETWIGGQASFFAVLIASAVIVCWRRQQWALAGALLALALYKPNVLALFAVAGLLYRPQMLRGAIPAGIALIALSLAIVGFDGLVEYASLSTQLASGAWDVATPYWKVHGLASWMAPFVSGHEKTLSCLIGLLAVVSLVIRWRNSEHADRSIQLLALGLVLTINTLLNPYAPIYDLTLLSLAALLTIESFADRPPGVEHSRGFAWAYLLLSVLYFGPHLSQAVAKVTGWQFFPLALAAMAVWQVRRFWQATGKTDQQHARELAPQSN